MTRAILKIVFLAVLLTAGALVLRYYRTAADPQAVENERLRQVNGELLQKNDILHQIVGRIESHRRVAKVLVVDQGLDAKGQLQTTCLFVEDARDGKSSLPPRRFTIPGNELILFYDRISFSDNFVETGDALRGQSIVLFLRAYGKSQRYDDGFDLETPGEIPAFYRGSDPVVSEFEQNLWKKFWRLTDDQAYSAAQGVKVANIDGKLLHLEPGKLYTFDINPNGLVNVSNQSIEPIYLDAMHSVREMTDFKAPINAEPRGH